MSEGQLRLLDAAEQSRAGKKSGEELNKDKIRNALCSPSMGKAGSISVLLHTLFRMTKTLSVQ